MSFVCSAPGCEREAKVGGLCIPCYNEGYDRRHRADNGEGKSPWEDKMEEEMKQNKTCAGCGKEKPIRAKGLCSPCYQSRHRKAKTGEHIQFNIYPLAGTTFPYDLAARIIEEIESRLEKIGDKTFFTQGQGNKKTAGAPPEPPKLDLVPERETSHGPIEELSKPIYLDGSGDLLVLDFTGHADLLKALTEARKKEFRRPSGQAMAILEKTLKGVKP